MFNSTASIEEASNQQASFLPANAFSASVVLVVRYRKTVDWEPGRADSNVYAFKVSQSTNTLRALREA
ncbi:hypothetical protein GLAREA_11364 [Glarea lozoyensis ATCC 20868]|uniref:Uncharacterized protein n=1 Tax=Glarea lozoyensis (strain ATCC 20868 / MF5171) TaxID=1116229 RepID=S3DEX7_GLAL2|nr:uncharacterized protein GLAREA_11364 [Glarea lozoyensis ATCC 20868]EPE35664.1 hypothetical protein GLAREA_11364 [Glarea lozoyensis ATCC 20868]